MSWRKVAYAAGRDGRINLPSCAPFDGKPVLIRTSTGIVEAWWQKWIHQPSPTDVNDGTGWQWICYDDAFQVDLDDALEWMPIP